MTDGEQGGRDRWVRDVLDFDVPPEQAGGDGAVPGDAPAAAQPTSTPTPQAPLPRGAIGPEQSARASALLGAMPPADQAAVQAVLDRAGPTERPYLSRAIASNHGAGEIAAFAAAIAGKDAAWMDANLHVVGTSNGAAGIKQQWRDSCGPTTIQAMRAELDPIYALKLRTDDRGLETADGRAPSGASAAEQKSILEAHGGKAVPRLSAEEPAAGADYGMTLTPALNEATAASGIRYSPAAFKGAASLGAIDAALKDGLPVPLRLANAHGGHFVVVTQGGASYLIHDPFSGTSVAVTGTQIVDRTFDIAGYNQVTHVYRPQVTP